MVKSWTHRFEIKKISFPLCLLMVFFNNISVISWWSVLLVEETGVPGENHRQVTDKLYHIMLYLLSTPRTHVIGTDCIGSYKSQLPYEHKHNGPLFIDVF